MESLANTAIHLPRLFHFQSSKHQTLKARTVGCSRLEDHNMGALQESLESSNCKLEINHNDIWKLFNDAQRNILYLNKQRLMAVEELNKIQSEKQMLLARIEQLEGEKQANVVKGSVAKPDDLSICCELLLRIDSMVVSGLIHKENALNLRRLVMDNKTSIAGTFYDINQRKDTELLTDIRNFSDESKREGFHIVHICTEMEPLVSIGSLASYVTGLSHAMQRKGNLVEVILPKYSCLDLDEVHGLRKVGIEVHSYFNGHWHGNIIWTGVVYGIGVTFIEPLYHSEFFNRDRIYGYKDDFERFTYFSRASLDYLVKSGKQPDVLHIHNWETAIVGPLFWDIFVNQGLGGTRVLFTCHGFNSQCLVHPDKLALCGLDPPRLHRPDRLQDNIKTHLVNILKGGVVYSNKVLVVSSILSKEMAIHSSSHGLESTLAIHKEKLSVAPYGLDNTIWDPSKDKFLPRNYSGDNLKGKAVCKMVLRQRLGFTGHASTVVGCIFSEVSDINLENLKAAVWLALRKGAELVFMGPRKIPSINPALESFQKELKDENARFINEYDEALSHLILAGSDIILCPSFHDPVLQIPLKAIKYGAAPVVITFNGGGFRSTNSSQYIINAFANMSLSQALDQIENDPLIWNQKIKDGISNDFSWDGECYDIHSAAYMSVKNL
ncbi:UDP-Glycosyltransferase superfamily protein [Tasmannia lanceolata]|uniref:UDP-Glycosyltransferase superfamily protein n=1 Tax=Tasmannia lanceolata TaxID=3420 RepID=UPI004063016A